MPDEARPLWQWILLAVAPGLICDVLGAFRMALGDADVEALEMLIMLTMLAAPLFGIVYLVVLGRRYVRAESGSVVLFVLGYGALNVLLWGAGCAMFLSEFKMDFR